MLRLRRRKARPTVFGAKVHRSVVRGRPVRRVIRQHDGQRARALRIGKPFVARRRRRINPSVRVDLSNAPHVKPAKVRTCLRHLLGADGVVPRRALGVRDGERRGDGDAVAHEPVQVRHPLDPGTLAGQLVEQLSPQALRNDEAHSAPRSRAVRAPRPAGSASRRPCAPRRPTSGSGSGCGPTCSTRPSC